MKNYKRRLVFPIAILFFISVSGIVFYKLNLKPEQNTQEVKKMDYLINEALELQRIWWEGEESKEWIQIKGQCLKALNITDSFDESLLRCNPLLIDCVNKFYKNKKFSLNPKKSYQYLSKTNSNILGIDGGGFLFSLYDEKTNKNLDVLLKDFCHETYLDQRIYAYGEMPKKSEGEDFKFDTLNQNIYLDRSLVSNLDINQWINFGDEEETKDLKIKEGNDLFLPATNLKLSQMENYCTYKGKELMNAHYFDAATFLPFDLENKTPTEIQRGPYFWSNKSKEDLKRCDYIFSKECLEKSKYHLNYVSPTWAGLYDSMGGAFEAFKNPIEPSKNLKVSSFYLPMKSKWHRLGVRTHWDGEGFDSKNFDFKNIDIDHGVNEFKVGFRCMRRVK